MNEKRFTAYEVIGDQSVKLIHDNKQDVGLTIEKIESKLNYFNESNKEQRDTNDELREINRLLWDVIDGMKAYWILKEKGYID